MIAMKAVRSVGKAASERALGLGPGPIRAGVASMITGIAVSVLTYKALRSDKLGGDAKS
jgi:hypothetical protein